jgi:hypothetical protein
VCRRGFQLAGFTEAKHDLKSFAVHIISIDTTDAPGQTGASSAMAVVFTIPLPTGAEFYQTAEVVTFGEYKVDEVASTLLTKIDRETEALQHNWKGENFGGAWVAGAHIMELCVTKLDAARRQLETAIWLYFYEGDPVSIHTLCCAAYDVIRALNRKRHSPTELNEMMLKDIGEFLGSKSEKKKFYDYLNASENFFKHANSDAKATHSFDTQYSEVLLFDAVHEYSRFVGECPKEMAIYFSWFVLSHPDIQFDIPDSARNQLKTASRILLKDGRKKFYQDIRPKAVPLKL